MGSPCECLTSHGIHSNVGGLSSYLNESEGLGTPATVGMGNKTATKWD
jgi:hypothetical protein